MQIITPANIDNFLNSAHAKLIVGDYYYVVPCLSSFYIINLIDETVLDCGDHNPYFILATQMFFDKHGPFNNSRILYSSKEACDEYNRLCKANESEALKNTIEKTWSEHKEIAMLLTLRKTLTIIHNEGKMVYAYKAISDMAELMALFKSKLRC